MLTKDHKEILEYMRESAMNALDKAVHIHTIPDGKSELTQVTKDHRGQFLQRDIIDVLMHIDALRGSKH